MIAFIDAHRVTHGVEPICNSFQAGFSGIGDYAALGCQSACKWDPQSEQRRPRHLLAAIWPFRYYEGAPADFAATPMGGLVRTLTAGLEAGQQRVAIRQLGGMGGEAGSQ